jgi:hypothetical protein
MAGIPTAAGTDMKPRTSGHAFKIRTRHGRRYKVALKAIWPRHDISLLCRDLLAQGTMVTTKFDKRA